MSNNLTTTALPEKFITRSIEHLGSDDAMRFLSSLDSEPQVSIRYNPYKAIEVVNHEQIPWSKNGFYLTERPKFTIDPLFHSGVYYPQEASSMFLEQYIERARQTMGSNLTVLDLCAAPGGKSTHLSALLTPESLIVANETIKSRAKILSENITKWGIGNVIVTNSDPEKFSSLHGLFDIVVIDTPCSGEGMFRKDLDSRNQWSEENVKLCAARSRRIVSNAYNCLREGGILIYSTCTYNREEDEQNVEWMAKTYGLANFSISPPKEWGITKSEVNNIECYKFMPHRTKGEGFFISAMQKTETEAKISVPRDKNIELASKSQTALAKQWIINSDSYTIATHNNNIYCIAQNHIDILNIIKKQLYIINFGTELGQFFGNDLKPSHALSLFINNNKAQLPIIEVDLSTAQEYLRKNTIDHTLFEQGINMVSYKQQAIGYIKRIGTRCNNLYPKEYRIYNL